MICCRRHMLVLMGLYSCLSFRICTAYVDWGSFCFIVISAHRTHCTIPHLYIQPSFWRWTLGFKTCRKHQKLKYSFSKCAFCRFILYNYITMPGTKNIKIHFFVCGYAVHFNKGFSFCKHTKEGNWTKSVTTNLECGFLLFQFLPKQAMSGSWKSYIYILCGDVQQLSFCTSEFSFQSNPLYLFLWYIWFVVQR